ncbi:MAG: SH3 domain-containing protein [Clostridia bacterium]|nr:SH3 domain-containing protein [Clostridia bacterium]
MKRPGCAMACACLLLSLLAGSALAESAWVETPKGALNARRKANSKSDIVIKIPNGSEVELLEDNGEWSQIEYKGKKGYVKSSFLSDEAPMKEEEPVMLVIQAGGYARIVTDGGTLNLRKKADAKSTVVAQVPNAVRVEVAEASLEWSSIVYQGKRGYVLTKYLALDSQMIGKQIYPDGDYLHVRRAPDAASQSVAAVSAAQPMTIEEIGEQWLRVACEDPLNGEITGYVSMKDVSLWRETPSRAAGEPVYVRMDVSSETLSLGEELDVTLSCRESAVCRIKVSKDGKTVMKERELTSRVFSYRPRQTGTYQMEVIVSEPGGGAIGCERLFTVTQAQASQDDGSFVLYSQKDGWWLDKKYSRSNLDQSGCAIFTLSHALALLGKASPETEPAVLGRDYAAYLAESGTVTSNLLAAASRNFGFKTEKDKIGDAQRIAQLFGEGAVFSFAIVNGHIALAAGLSEDGTKVRVVDSAPSATMERIEGAQMYLEDGRGGWKVISSLWDVPGAKYYPETDQFSGMEYYLDLSYVAGRGVRLIAPK